VKLHIRFGTQAALDAWLNIDLFFTKENIMLLNLFCDNVDMTHSTQIMKFAKNRKEKQQDVLETNICQNLMCM
jgi:hypothetical protein